MIMRQLLISVCACMHDMSRLVHHAWLTGSSRVPAEASRGSNDRTSSSAPQSNLWPARTSDLKMAASGLLAVRPPMDLSKAVVCITGGSDGIGLGFARQFMKANITVIVTGRTAETLQRAQDSVPGLHTFQGDVGKIADREKLTSWLIETHPDLNVFVSNAGKILVSAIHGH